MLIGYCEVKIIHDYVFIIGFTIFLGIDILRYIGDRPKTRVFVTSFLLSIRSSLGFLLYKYYHTQSQEHIEKCKDDGTICPWEEGAAYLYGMLSAANFILLFIALIIMMLIMFVPALIPKYARIIKISSVLVLLALGWTFATWYYTIMVPDPIMIVAVVLMMYDIQYIGDELQGVNAVNNEGMSEVDADVPMDAANDEEEEINAVLDPNMDTQSSVFNINNRFVRWTFWCIVVIVFAMYQMVMDVTSKIVYEYKYLLYTKDDDYKSSIDWAKKNLKVYDVGISSEVFASAAMILLLIQIHLKIKSIPLKLNERRIQIFLVHMSAVSLFIAMILRIVRIVLQIDAYCIYTYDNRVGSNYVEKGYCKVSYFAGYIFEILFTVYFIFDLVKFIFVLFRFDCGGFVAHSKKEQ